MKLSFVIPTRNRRESLKRCLDSIETQRYAERETIVVVDGSTDDTADMLAAEYPHVKTIVLPERGGIGVAVDRGTREASGEILVNLDDDAHFVSPDAADLIVEGFRDAQDVAALCFRVEAPDGSVRHREIPLRSKRLPSTDTDIGYFLGGAVAMRRRCLDAIGGYPTDIAYGGNELPMAFKFFKKGWRIVFKPSIREVHYAIPSEHNTRERPANDVRSAIRLAASYLPVPYAQVHATLWIAQNLAFAARDGGFGLATRATFGALGEWGRLRRENAEWRLTVAETRRLSALSGRTWY